MASSNNFDIPHSPPPSNDSTTVIVVVFVSLGGVLFFAFLAFALCCFIKKRNKKLQETDLIRVDEHLKVKEAIVDGPRGPKSVVLEIEDDLHVDEVIKKQEEENMKFGHGQNKSLEIESKA
ncbi:protein TRACHEARY ELEMENT DIFFERENTIATION-RELATED 6 [Mercurialis annua]|uniref:protein TRACHEARY ELEMENT DIFFERENTIATION-RELATED 6 n=1 Tax=Mercurialis annua TaxID=3986 RepID=UPI002160280C|nr:protein TRACHEARY ELEMENT DIFFERENTIATION-RELATED 6 [Mercurialis annua]